MSTLRERVDEVLPALSRRGIPSIREWCRLADVQESYLNRRMHAKGDRPDFKKFEALAQVAGVDARWLAYGDGAAPGGAGVSDSGAVAPRAAPELRVEREDQHVPEDDEVPLETALFAVFAARRKDYTTADFDAARASIRAAHRKTHPNADLDGHARQLLDAAKQLRVEGVPVNPTNLAMRVAAGKTQRAAELVREVSDAYNAETDDELRAKGLEPGAGRANIEALLAAKKARKEKGGQ